MRATYSFVALLAAAALGTAPVQAQGATASDTVSDKSATTESRQPGRATDSVATAAKAPAPSLVPEIVIQRYRATDQRGINVYEAPKTDAVPFTGFKISFGAAFTQQFQGLEHSSTAAPVMKPGPNNTQVNANQLLKIGNGFNNAVANLYLNAQLAPGIRVAMTTYLSSRHHQETWVKDGYLLVDESPIKVAALETLMKYVTLRAGHFEINYGDEHFRRTDNGNAMYNPFVGNLIMDAFTTQIGGEVYVRNGPWMVMGGVTNGEVRGQVTVPERRSPAYLGKLGFDKQINDVVRVRLTGSLFSQARSANNTLFTGDRAGSRYYQVMVNTSGTEKDSAWTGSVQPGLRSETRTWVVNPFVEIGGLELRANIEQAKGRAANEPANREWTQNAYEGLYRFAQDKLFLGARYNTVEGRLSTIANDVSVNRYQLGGGWFITPSILLKGEYMQQKYNDFPRTDIRNGGKINGFMMEGVISF